MHFDLMKKTAVFSILFFIASMCAIMYFSYNKVITISNVAQDEVQGNSQKQGTAQVEDSSDEEETEKLLTFTIGEANTNYLSIPLPAGLKAENITIENHYMDKELWIAVDNTKEAFYKDHAVSGNREWIEQGYYEKTGNGVKLKLILKEVYECHTVLENDTLYVNFMAPREAYSKIVVIDPSAGGKEEGIELNGLREKDITLAIARKLKEKLDHTDIKAYYTRMDDVCPSEEERVLLANETKADMYIRIQVSQDKNTGIYGTAAIYNGDYFIPGFGSIELADILEREVVTVIKGKAIGLVEADASEYAVRQATVPAAAISAGYLSNKQEAILLKKDEYLDKIANGIYNAIVEVYKNGS